MASSTFPASMVREAAAARAVLIRNDEFMRREERIAELMRAKKRCGWWWARRDAPVFSTRAEAEEALNPVDWNSPYWHTAWDEASRVTYALKNERRALDLVGLATAAEAAFSMVTLSDDEVKFLKLGGSTQ